MITFYQTCLAALLTGNKQLILAKLPSLWLRHRWYKSSVKHTGYLNFKKYTYFITMKMRLKLVFRPFLSESYKKYRSHHGAFFVLLFGIMKIKSLTSAYRGSST